jgi:acetyl esterase/lipase
MDLRNVLKPLVGFALLALGCQAPREIEDVSYDDRFGSDTVMDLYLPDDGGRHPAVMMIHGGAWLFGDKQHYQNAGRRLARSGWAAASINYRLLPDGHFPLPAQDCNCALAFLQQHADEYGIDPKRIAVMGYSAGGHLSALVATAWDEPVIRPDCAAGTPSRPAAAIPGSGLYDLRELSDAGLIQDFMDGTIEDIPALYEAASPVAQVDGSEPPFLLMTGGADWIAPYQTPGLRDALREAGVEVEVLRLAGNGHLLQPGADSGELQLDVVSDTPEAWLALTDFLVRTMGEP